MYFKDEYIHLSKERNSCHVTGICVCLSVSIFLSPMYIQGWHAVAEIDKHEWQPGYNACEQEAINMALQDNQGAGN